MATTDGDDDDDQDVPAGDDEVEDNSGCGGMGRTSEESWRRIAEDRRRIGGLEEDWRGMGEDCRRIFDRYSQMFIDFR